MKKCLFCGESIDENAIKCRYCFEWLKIDRKKKFFGILKHPLLIAVVSTGVLGVIILLLGRHFEQRNWMEQHRLSTSQVQYQNLFEKRSEIARLACLNIKKREVNIHCLYNARLQPEKMKFLKYWEQKHSLISEGSAIEMEIDIYFNPYKDLGIKETYQSIHDIMLNIETELSKNETAKKLTKKLINERMGKANELELSLIQMFKKVFTEMDEKMKNRERNNI